VSIGGDSVVGAGAGAGADVVQDLVLIGRTDPHEATACVLCCVMFGPPRRSVTQGVKRTLEPHGQGSRLPVALGYTHRARAIDAWRHLAAVRVQAKTARRTRRRPRSRGCDGGPNGQTNLIH